VDYTWPSPGPDFVNSLPAEHLALLEELDIETAGSKTQNAGLVTGKQDEHMVTPPLDAVDEQIPLGTMPSNVAL
jgi:hypothetical protein